MALHGDAKSDALWVIGFFIVIGLLWLATGGPSHPLATSGPLLPQVLVPTNPGYNPGATISPAPPPTPSLIKEGVVGTSAANSAYSGQVRIGQGNAAFTYQPSEEYITLDADYGNSAPINITGWALTNGRSERRLVIPVGVNLFLGILSRQNSDPIILNSGDHVVLTTGSPPPISPSLVSVNFRTNLCTGYLGQLPDYQFTPSLYSTCPAPQNEPGTQGLDNDCYNFVRYLPSCHTPKLERRADGNDYTDNTLNLSMVCRNYVVEHFSYGGCLRYHQNDSNFLGREWRVYLRQTWELWAENRETITLYDNLGKIVDQLKY